MLNAQTPVPGSTAVLVDHDRKVVPPWQEQRLERTLARFFPAGCGLNVLVTAGWNAGEGSWQISRVLVESSGGFRNFTRRVRDGLAAQGLPVDD